MIVTTGNMSLLAVLKYPLSNPPQSHEIKALPYDVIERWAYNSLTFRKILLRAEEEPRYLTAFGGLVNMVSCYFDQIWFDEDPIKCEELKILRKVLLEYEEC